MQKNDTITFRIDPSEKLEMVECAKSMFPNITHPLSAYIRALHGQHRGSPLKRLITNVFLENGNPKKIKEDFKKVFLEEDFNEKTNFERKNI